MRLAFATDDDFPEIGDRFFPYAGSGGYQRDSSKLRPGNGLRALLVRSWDDTISGLALFRAETDHLAVLEFLSLSLDADVGRLMADGLRFAAKERNLDSILLQVEDHALVKKFLVSSGFELLAFQSPSKENKCAKQMGFWRLAKQPRANSESAKSTTRPVSNDLIGPS